MKRHKKGFTLVELIVAIACSTIVFLSVTSSVYFIYRMNNKVLSESSINYNLAKLKNQIIDNKYFDEDKFDVSNKNLLYDGKTISNSVEVISIDIYDEIDRNQNVFTYCQIQFINADGLAENLNFIIK